MSVRLTIDLPEEAFSVLRTSPERFAEELKRAAICKWYELGRISQAKGAALAGVSRRDFLTLLGEYNVSPFQTTSEELSQEATRA